MGGGLPQQDPYPTGVRYRWLVPSDILWFLSSADRWTRRRSYFKLFGSGLLVGVFVCIGSLLMTPNLASWLFSPDGILAASTVTVTGC